ncbi:glutathione S-transferase LANCL1 isoform X1 [Ixodes scapularis]|uniref:glutathione S-transferase LANCL1 isoform X1 n=1 Tax=Ixodes scapularis TaxID=6945 RepID=UPI001C37F943|nr:glutathione S-transferase LANCL1 isoform X1 [Ixodes scapularis]
MPYFAGLLRTLLGMTDRAFENKFADYDGSSDVILPDGKFTHKFEQDVRKHLLELVAVLEKNLDKHTDWNDASVYTGTTGVALMYMNLAERLGDPVYLKRALPLVETQLKGLKERRFSFLCGDAGPLAVGAVLYHLLGREEDSQKLVKKLLDLSKHVVPLETDIPDELLYGRVGYLSALLFVRKHIATAVVSSEVIRDVVCSVLESGQRLSARTKASFPLMYQWHESYYLGAAHGLSGILYMLLQGDKDGNGAWQIVRADVGGLERKNEKESGGRAEEGNRLQVRAQLSEAELKDLVRPSVDAFVSLQYPSGNFPSSLGSETDKLVHWCHGAPGAAHLLALARTVFDDARYLDPLRKSVDVIWRRGLLKKGYGICHGVAGNAYAFLRMYQLTRELKYLHRAAKFAEWCFDYGHHNCRIADRPFSLFEGMAGTIYYMADLLEPGKAAFPAFQLC